jgi:hypothetical protein
MNNDLNRIAPVIPALPPHQIRGRLDFGFFQEVLGENHAPAQKCRLSALGNFGVKSMNKLTFYVSLL